MGGSGGGQWRGHALTHHLPYSTVFVEAVANLSYQSQIAPASLPEAFEGLREGHADVLPVEREDSGGAKVDTPIPPLRRAETAQPKRGVWGGTAGSQYYDAGRGEKPPMRVTRSGSSAAWGVRRASF